MSWRPPILSGGLNSRQGGEEVRRNPVLEAADIATELLVRASRGDIGGKWGTGHRVRKGEGSLGC
eukprot:273581-Pyramimonas_sp.AAC.1